MIRADILATGEEIRSGALVDSNSAWLAQNLEENRLCVRRHLCVGDDVDDLATALADISSRAQVGVITGGLGPTPDDLSARAAALALGVELELRPQALADIQAFFHSLGREMPESNRKQALLPQGALMLPNPVGTAPGFQCILSGCRLYFLPGVPAEMRRMFRESVLPDLQVHFQGQLQSSITRTLSTFGLTESGAAHSVQELTRLFPDIGLGFRVSFPEVQIKLSFNGPDRAQVASRLDQAAAWVQQKLGSHVFSHQEESMAAVLQNLLRQVPASLAVAESCTGGLISHWLTEVSGSSDVFTLGAVTYANTAKERLLGVRTRTLAEHGAVSEPVAREMAQGVRRAGEAEFGLATTGIAGPSGGSEAKPVGTVCIGLAGPEEAVARTFHFRFRSRSQNKIMFAMTGMDMLRRHLLPRNEPESERK